GVAVAWNLSHRRRPHRETTTKSSSKTSATTSSRSGIRELLRFQPSQLGRAALSHVVRPLKWLCSLQALLAMKGWFASLSSRFNEPTNKELQQQHEQDEIYKKNRAKLQGYHQLAQEAFQRAYAADSSGNVSAAVRLYGTGLQAAAEGLALPVQGSGLGSLADSVSSWRRDLAGWQRDYTARLQALQAPGCTGHPAATGSAAAAAAPVRPLPHATMALHQQQQQQQGMSVQVPFHRPAGGSSAGGSKSVIVQRPPQVSAAGGSRRTTGSTSGGGGGGGTGGGAAAGRDDTGGTAKYRETIMGEILDRSPSVKWDDVAGLATAKKALTEAVILPALRPDLFQGLRAPVRGILLYGPPGNGKTMLAKALAAESRATFFNISASSLTSKWVGDAEKLVRALFETAAQLQPAIIFMDELDSMMGSRGGAGESDAARRLLTEFLVQFDGVVGGGAGRERVVVVGATNRPQELDDAVRRRLTKRIYIPLPDEEGRMAVLTHLLKGQAHRLSSADLHSLVSATAGYSASDLAALCKEAAMAPLRELPASRLAHVPASALRPLGAADFGAALRVVRPSVNAASLRSFEEFTREYGT
ncbi:hypothetical protein Agub_g7903, partial [Astrephomene gubernaculifera]